MDFIITTSKTPEFDPDEIIIPRTKAEVILEWQKRIKHLMQKKTEEAKRSKRERIEGIVKRFVKNLKLSVKIRKEKALELKRERARNAILARQKAKRDKERTRSIGITSK